MSRAKAQDDAVIGIVGTLREEIISGALAPGQALRQEHLADRFGISRMPVREAIQQLISLGFVTLDQTRHARVAAISREDFAEIYEMRVALETLAIRSAIPLLGNVHIDAALAVQREIEEAPPEEFGRLNTDFHTTLYAPCGRPRLLNQIDNLGKAADRYMFMVSAGEDMLEKSYREHYELCHACLARDEAAAVACLTRHIGDAYDAFAPMFDG